MPQIDYKLRTIVEIYYRAVSYMIYGKSPIWYVYSWLNLSLDHPRSQYMLWCHVVDY